jgi:sorting nexin-1/2
LYVPALPPKKAVGNKDIRFVIERRYFLERFIKQISRYPFIVNQEEFRIFTRPEFTGGHSDIEKQI